jgi:hypothetical protein
MKKAMLFCVLVGTLFVTFANAANSVSASLDVSLTGQNPDPARAGEMVELRFTVENTGGQPTNDLQFELLLQYPFMEIPGEEYSKTINAMKAYQQGADAVTIKYKVRVDKDAVKGNNEIKLRSTEKDSAISVIETFSIEVTGTEYAQIIYIDKSLVTPGEETPLKFTITNVGNSPLQNLVFSWSEENGAILPVYSDDTKYIKYIDVGESVDLEYTVVADINAEYGLYQLDLTLEFETEEGVSEEMNTKAGIFIGGETDFDVTFSESSEGQTSLSISNTGNNPALSVTVRVPEQENFMVSGSTSSIIGNLDSGDYTIVSFQITQAGAWAGGRMNGTTTGQTPSPQGNNLRVLIEYTDTTGVRHSLEKYVQIQFRSINTDTTTNTGFRQRTNIWTTYLPYIVLAVVIVAGIALFKKKEYVRNRFFKK